MLFSGAKRGGDKANGIDDPERNRHLPELRTAGRYCRQRVVRRHVGVGCVAVERLAARPGRA